MSCTGMSESPPGRPRLSIRRDPLSTSPAVIAAGFAETVSVDLVNYVAQGLGYDTEECIQKALEDDEIEMYQPNGRRRGYDVYRLTARGRKAANRYLTEVFTESAERAKRAYEEEQRGDVWPAVDRPGDRPPLRPAPARP